MLVVFPLFRDSSGSRLERQAGDRISSLEFAGVPGNIAGNSCLKKGSAHNFRIPGGIPSFRHPCACACPSIACVRGCGHLQVPGILDRAGRAIRIPGIFLRLMDASGVNRPLRTTVRKNGTVSWSLRGPVAPHAGCIS